MRTAVIAHYNNHEFIKKLDRHIFNVCYKSKRYNYVYLYFNEKNKQKAMQILNDIYSIVEIEPSLLDVESIVF